MNYNDAKDLVQRQLDELERVDPNINDLVIQDEYTINHKNAWVFVFNSRKFLEEDDASSMIVPNGIVVPHFHGDWHYAPSYLDIYSYLDSL